MKVGKEEIIGLMTAIRWYLGLDHDKLLQTYEDQVAWVVQAFAGHPAVTARRSFPSEAGQPHPRAEVIFDEEKLGLKLGDILRLLADGDPAVFLTPAGENSLFINPQTLDPGEEKIIVDRIKNIVAH
jgi:L-seryl-tRNA(Ser) seleniumtransferase